MLFRSFDTYAYAHLHKVSIEMAARNLRYSYFAQLVKDLHAGGICVAQPTWQAPLAVTSHVQAYCSSFCGISAKGCRKTGGNKHDD